MQVNVVLTAIGLICYPTCPNIVHRAYCIEWICDHWKLVFTSMMKGYITPVHSRQLSKLMQVYKCFNQYN